MAARRRTARSKRVQESRLAARISTLLAIAVKALKDEDVAFCVVGGLARSVLAEPRTTKDVDLAIAAGSEAEADRIVFGMVRRGFVVRELFQRKNQLATIRLTHGADSTRVDLLFATSGIEALVVAAAREMDVGKGVRAPVVLRPHLIAMKLAARRKQDLADIEALLERSSKAEIAQVSPLIAELPEAKRAAALVAWRDLLQERERPSEFKPDPARLRRLRQPPPK